MVRSASIGIRVEPALKDALEEAARKDRRTVASLIEKVLEAWLVEHGHLQPGGAE